MANEKPEPAQPAEPASPPAAVPEEGSAAEEAGDAEAREEQPAETEGSEQPQDACQDKAAIGGQARDLARIATRIFGTPLLVQGAKLEVILGVMGSRLGLDAPRTTEQGAAAPPPIVRALFGDDEDLNAGGDERPYDLTADGVAIVAVDGTLVYKSSWLGALSGLTAYNDIAHAFSAAVADPQVKGVLLTVDSYGGEVNGCFDLADQIFAGRQQKPVYAVAADDAFSAAYGIAAAADRLFVSRTSGVGSIGVVALHVDQSAADKMDGLKYTYVHAGARKVDGNAHEPLSSPARKELQARCDSLQQLFAGSVAKYRGGIAEDFIKLEAGCFYGDDAIAKKLADQVGTPSDALTALRAEIARRAAAVIGAPILAAPPTAPATAAAAASPGPAPGAEVIDLAAVRGEAAAKASADALEIVASCNLAGHPELAAEYMRRGLTLAAVREDLQSRRASASASRLLSGHLMPDAGATDPEGMAKDWVKAVQGAGLAVKQ